MAEKFVLTAQLNTQLNVASVQATIRQLRSQLQSVTVNLNVTGASQVNRQMQQVAATTEKVTKNVAQGRDVMGDFGRAGALAAKRFAAFSIATAGFIAFVSAIRNGAKAAIDFERQMIRISQVTGVSMNGLKDLKNTISDLSTGLGVSSEKLVDISRVLAQTGMSARDTKIALEALAKTELAPTFTNIQKTTEAAIAAMRQFNIEAGKLEQTLGQMNALAANFAVEADDLGVVIRRAGGAFKSAGGSLLELEALFTSVRSTTRESAETIATGFRTIFTRLRRPKTIDYLKELGINLEDMTGKFVGPYEAVRRLNTALKDLDPRDTRYAAIIEQLGGFRQVSKVIPLIQQFEKAELARATAMRGSSSLTRDAISAQDALAIRLIKVKESFAEMMRQFLDNKGIQLFIDMSLRLAEALIKIASALEPLIPLIAALAGGALFKGAGRLLGGVKGGLGFAKGGVVPGTGNTDSVPARLTPGEFVIRKGAAARIGADNLHAMNKYAAGGMVRKGRSGYGTATFKVGSPTKPKVGAFFMLPDEKDTVSREGVGAGVPFAKLNRSSKKMLNMRTGRPAGNTDDDWNWAKGHKIKIQAPKAQMLLGPPESKDIKEATEVKSREAIADVSKIFLEKFEGIGGKPSKEGKKTVANVDFKSIAGHIFEGVISTVTGAMLQGGGAGWDYKSPIPWKKLDVLFGSAGKSKEWQKSVVAMDAKRTKGSNANVSLNTKVVNAFKTAQKGKASNVTMRDLGIRSKNIGLESINMAPGSTGKGEGGASEEMRRQSAVKKRKKRAAGGIVDSVPALLTPGEFVVNKASAQAIGYGNLKGMNKYAAGGIVRKGRGNYGGVMTTTSSSTEETGKGGPGLGMLFAADMVLSFATTLVDAESTIGKVVGMAVNAITGYIAVMAILQSETIQLYLTQKLANTGLAKFGNRMAKSGAAAVGFALAANEAGNMLKKMGSEALEASGGKEGTGMMAVGGAISAGGMGGAIGAMAGGIPGAIIGAIVGALYGVVTALEEAATQIKLIELGKTTKGFKEGMRNVELGFRNIGSMGPEFQQAMAGITKGLHSEEKVREKAQQEAKQGFSSYQKTIQDMAKSSLSLNQFFTKIPQSALNQFAKMNDIPYDKLEQQIRDQIEANKAAIKATKDLEASMKQAEDINRSMANIDSAVSHATASIMRFGGAIDAIAGKGKAFDLEKGVISRPDRLSREERESGGRMDREIAAIASVLPEGRRDELTEEASEEIRLLSQVRDAVIVSRAELSRQGVEGDKADEVLRAELLRRATPGKRGKDAVDKIMTGVQGATGDKLGAAIGGPGAPGDMDKIMKGAERDIKREIDTLKRLAKYINMATKQYEKAYSVRAKLEMELVKETRKLVDLQRQRFVTMKKLRAGGGVGAGSITPEESEAFFQKKQAAALGTVGMAGAVAPGGQVNVGALGQQFRDLGRSIEENKIKLTQSSTETELANQDHLQRQRGLIETIKQEETQRKVLTGVIKDFQNVQQRTAALQEKINQLNQQASKRRSMVDQYAGATDESRAEMDRVADMARRIADGTEQFSNVPGEMRGSVQSFIQDMASQGGPIGDKFMGAAGDIRVQTARDLGINLDADQEKQLRAQPTSEVQKLTQAVNQAYTDAIGLQNEGIIKGITEQQASLETAITNLHTLIKTELPKVLMREDIVSKSQEIEQLKLVNVHLKHVEILLTDLKTMGVDTESQATVAIVQSIPGEVKRRDEALRTTVRAGNQMLTSGDAREAESQKIQKDIWGEGGGSGIIHGKDTEKNIKKYIDKRKDLALMGTVKNALDVGKLGITEGASTQAIMSKVKDLETTKKGDPGGEGFIKQDGRVTTLKIQDLTSLIAVFEDAKHEAGVTSPIGDFGTGKRPGMQAPWTQRRPSKVFSGAGGPPGFARIKTIDNRLQQKLVERFEKKLEASRNHQENLDRSLHALLSEDEDYKRMPLDQRFKARERVKERIMREDVHGVEGGVAEGMGEGTTLGGTQGAIRENNAEIKGNTTAIDLNTKALEAIRLQQEKIKGAPEGSGAGASIMDPNVQYFASIPPQQIDIDEANRRPTQVQQGGVDVRGTGTGGRPVDDWDYSKGPKPMGPITNVGVTPRFGAGGERLERGGVGTDGWDYDKGPKPTGPITNVEVTETNYQRRGRDPFAGEPGHGGETDKERKRRLVEKHGEKIPEVMGGWGGLEKIMFPMLSFFDLLKDKDAALDVLMPEGMGPSARKAKREERGQTDPAWIQPDAERTVARWKAEAEAQGLQVVDNRPSAVMANEGVLAKPDGGGGDGGGFDFFEWFASIPAMFKKPEHTGTEGADWDKPDRERLAAARKGQPAEPAGAVGNGIAMASAPEMDKWTKSMTALSSTMTTFTAAFEGGMVWTIEGKHDINVNLNGAEVLATLPEMFETLVITQTRAVLKKYVADHFPHLAVVSSDPMGSS